jgi:antitoxin (DNA-binding transcriptional repressor) of toxin-antitoxin stability system
MAGKPAAKLVPYERDPGPRDLDQGIWQGQVWIAEDFDELPSRIEAAFDGVDEPLP